MHIAMHWSSANAHSHALALLHKTTQFMEQCQCTYPCITCKYNIRIGFILIDLIIMSFVTLNKLPEAKFNLRIFPYK